jgi:ribosome-associated toxin RatA of RatAB toxin-antitoxin module
VRDGIIAIVKHVIRSMLVPHSAEKMYALVNDVPSYPEFLPWCGGAEVLEHTYTRMKARVSIAYLGLHQSFTTDNALETNKKIDLKLVSGPFSKLAGEWRFTQLGDVGCKVEFELHYSFEGVLEILVAPVFDRIAATFVDAFVKRADDLHL